MRIAMHNWMRAEPIEVTVARLARCGYDALAISGEPDRYETKYLRSLLADHGLTCWGAAVLMRTEQCLIDPDAGTRARAVRVVTDTIDMVHELDGEVVTVVPGAIGQLLPAADPAEEWQWAIDGLRECDSHAVKRGIRLAVEPINRFESYFLNRHDQALLLAQAVGPTCGVALDAFHMNIEERDPSAAIRASATRLYDVHVADSNRLACGMGTIDWPGLLGTLRDISYTGALAVEFVPPVDRTPANPYRAVLEQAHEGPPAGALKFTLDHGTGTLSDDFYEWLASEAIRTLRAALAE